MNKIGFFGRVVSHAIKLSLGVLLSFCSLGAISFQANALVLPSYSQQEPIQIALQNSSASNSVRASTSFVSQAVARTGAAVVRIDTERTISQRAEPLFNDPFFQDFFGERFGDSFPQERQVRGQGSGFIIDKKGIVLTNAHVVSGADKVTVTLKDGREFLGKVTGTDKVTDLAVINIDAQGADLPVAPLGNSSEVEVGDWAIAVGNPVGLNNTVTLGIISTLARSSAQVGIPDKRVDFLQTDAAINPGNSGGPLLNERGEVIGINTAIRADATGIGFAIPIDKVKTITTTLAAGKQVPHPYVGVQMITLTPELAQRNNNDPNSAFFIPEVKGVLVMRVMQNTPAANAGIRRGDVIVSVDSQAIQTAGELQSLVDRSGLDQTLNFEIMRGDRTLIVDVKTTQLDQMS